MYPWNMKAHLDAQGMGWFSLLSTRLSHVVMVIIEVRGGPGVGYLQLFGASHKEHPVHVMVGTVVLLVVQVV